MRTKKKLTNFSQKKAGRTLIKNLTRTKHYLKKPLKMQMNKELMNRFYNKLNLISLGNIFIINIRKRLVKQMIKNFCKKKQILKIRYITHASLLKKKIISN